MGLIKEQTEWKELPEEKLLAIRAEAAEEYEELKAKGLKLDLSRGKPGADVLDLSNKMLDALDTYKTEDGTDIRNYGLVDGLPECKNFFFRSFGTAGGSNNRRRKQQPDAYVQYIRDDVSFWRRGSLFSLG
jgi:DNA repair protein RadC